MKSIIILNGAGKKNGNTAAMIRAFSDAAKANGNEIKEFYLQTMNIHGCLDCGGCHRKEKGSLEPCVQKDDMYQIYPAFREADVIVFASPVYWWDVTGTLKTAEQYVHQAQAVRNRKGGQQAAGLRLSGYPDRLPGPGP